MAPQPPRSSPPTATSMQRSVSFFVLELSRGPFIVAWMAVLAAHGACAACLAVIAAAHLVLAHPFLSFYAALATSSSGHRLPFVGGVHAALAALHLARVAHLLWLSWCSRRLVFSSPPSAASSSTQLSTTQSTSHVLTLSGLRRTTTRSQAHAHARSRWRLLWDLLWHRRRGLFGVESTHFETLFTVRECAEIASLTFQVFRYSEHIAKPAINRLSVAMLVLNCWSVGVAQLVFQRSPAKARVACLVLDVVLACGCVLLVPLVILRPYIHALDLATFRFDYRLVYDDIGFTDLITESRQIFSTATVDLLAKVVAHLSVWTGLVSVSTLVAPSHRRARRDSSVAADASFSAVRRRGHSNTAAVAPAQQWRNLVHAHESNELVKTRLASTRHKALHTLIALWGLVVLALHGAASHHSATLPLPQSMAAERRCKQRLRPWLRSAMTCSVVSLRCDDGDSASHSSDSISADALEPFDADGVRVLLIAHCPALVMPPALARFRNLLGVDVFNSTIVEWSRASGAALSAARHPLAVFAALFMVNMSSVPEGINHDDLPPSLSDLELSFTNLTTLPDDVANHWSRVSTLYVEHSQLREIPAPLLALVAGGTFYDLSVHGNAIAELPTELFFGSASSTPAVELFSLGLSLNPIAQLPAEPTTERQPIKIGFLSLETTLLPSLPDWVLSKATTIEVNVAGSPMCETPDRVLPPVVSCSSRARYVDGYYPWRFMLARRQWTPL